MNNKKPVKKPRVPDKDKYYIEDMINGSLISHKKYPLFTRCEDGREIIFNLDVLLPIIESEDPDEYAIEITMHHKNCVFSYVKSIFNPKEVRIHIASSMLTCKNENNSIEITTNDYRAFDKIRVVLMYKEAVCYYQNRRD